MQIKVFMVMEHEFASKLIKIDKCRGRDLNTSLPVRIDSVINQNYAYGGRMTSAPAR